MFVPLITLRHRTDRVVLLNRQYKYVFNLGSLVQNQSVIKKWFNEVFKVTTCKGRIMIPYKKHMKYVKHRRYKRFILGLKKGQEQLEEFQAGFDRCRIKQSSFMVHCIQRYRNVNVLDVANLISILNRKRNSRYLLTA